MRKRRSFCGVLPFLALCGLLANGCESELSAPRDEQVPSNDISALEQISSRVLSWDLLDTSESDHSEILATSPQVPGLKNGPGNGDECNGLEIYVTLHDMGALMEVEAQFHNPNNCRWIGELHVDCAHEDDPFVRHGLVQNLDAEFDPGGWAELFVLMVKPEVPGLYNFRALGISGKASAPFTIDPTNQDVIAGP